MSFSALNTWATSLAHGLIHECETGQSFVSELHSLNRNTEYKLFIIFEGPDGAGKTTMIADTALALWRIGHGTVLINPKRSPNLPELVEYRERLGFYKPRGGIDLILDRCWYSENVYGPIWRGAGLPPDVERDLDTWADGLGAVVARLDAPDHVLEERLRDRGDPDVTPEDIKTYAQLYREQSQSWGLNTLTNPTIADLIVRAGQAESEASR